MRLLICLAALALGCGKHEDRHDKAEQPAALSLAVTIDGALASWGADDFAKVPHYAGKNNDGEARDVWSLRDFAHQLAGPTARVVSVTGASGTVPIAVEAWNDASRTPILHTTRRGTLKFRWADKDSAWGETGVKDVTGLVIAK